MSKLNYNRPNGGYSKLRTAKELPEARPLTRQQRQALAIHRSQLRSKHRAANQDPVIKHGQHPARVTGVPGRYWLWCSQCDCEILSLTQQEYQIWRELNPPQIQRAQK